jgi:deoxyribodipyrimidine photo-lyase
VTAFTGLLRQYDVKQVFVNRDYEPYALDRDEQVSRLAKAAGISFHSYKDQVILDGNELVKDNGEPYTVFTPYSRRWKSTLNDFYLSAYPCERYAHRFLQLPPEPVPALEKLGFRKTDIVFPPVMPDMAVIRGYGQQRDVPALDATSHLGIHLRFGTVSIRKLAAIAIRESEVFLNELIWREFYQSILFKFPKVGKGQSFKKEYDRIPWRNDESGFERWCAGLTGYPIVDAGMRQLNATGLMHNRVRMITASFLAKHLLINWRWGEAYFAQKLLDYDMASNNGGWQWAAGSGCDAAPYFQDIQSHAANKKI